MAESLRPAPILAMMRCVETLTVVGFLLNVIGLGMAGTALMVEHRARRLGDLPGVAGGRRLMLRVRRMIGRPQHATISVGSATGTIAFGGKAYIHVTEPIDPGAPAHVQVAALERNIRKLLDIRVQQQRDRDAEQDERARALGTRLDDLKQELIESDRADQQVARKTIHTEMVGLLLAVLGTVIAAVPEVWSVFQ